MSERPWSDWYNEVMPDLPGAPPGALVTNAIRNAAIEFCDRTWVYRIEMEPIGAEADVPDYDLEPPAKTTLVKVHRLWYDKCEIFPKSPEELSGLFPHWPSVTGTPAYFTQRTPDVVLLVPMPAAALEEALTGELAIKPARSATGIATEIYEKYLEEIAYGAKARLFAMLRKPWSDGKLAAYNLAKFDECCGKAKVQAMKGHTRAHQRVKAHFY